MSDWDDHEAHNFAMSMDAEESARQDEEHKRAVVEHAADFDDETQVDLGGGMVVPLRELMEDDDD